MGNTVLQKKSYEFAIEIVKICQKTQEEKREYVLTKQILRSGTAIGALIREAEFGQSRADFINKLSVSLKEANETNYWLSIMHDTGYMPENTYAKMQSDCKEIIAILVASIKTLKSKN